MSNIFNETLVLFTNNFAKHDRKCLVTMSHKLGDCNCGLVEALSFVLEAHRQELDLEYERGANSKPDEFDEGIF